MLFRDKNNTNWSRDIQVSGKGQCLKHFPWFCFNLMWGITCFPALELVKPFEKDIKRGVGQTYSTWAIHICHSVYWGMSTDSQNSLNENTKESNIILNHFFSHSGESLIAYTLHFSGAATSTSLLWIIPRSSSSLMHLITSSQQKYREIIRRRLEKGRHRRDVCVCVCACVCVWVMSAEVGLAVSVIESRACV